MKILSIRLSGLLAMAIACGGRGDGKSASSSSTAVATDDSVSVGAQVASSTTAKVGCPRTGQWALCSVEKRLAQSGFVVHPLEGQAVRRPGFSVVPAVYNLGRSRLEVFLYPSATAAAKDAAGLDTTIAAPRGQRSPWPMPPTFVRSVNLIAVYLTDSPVHAERLGLALTAGAPQP